jgi:hypothetical protein
LCTRRAWTAMHYTCRRSLRKTLAARASPQRPTGSPSHPSFACRTARWLACRGQARTCTLQTPQTAKHGMRATVSQRHGGSRNCLLTGYLRSGERRRDVAGEERSRRRALRRAHLLELARPQDGQRVGGVALLRLPHHAAHARVLCDLVVGRRLRRPVVRGGSKGW